MSKPIRTTPSQHHDLGTWDNRRAFCSYHTTPYESVFICDGEAQIELGPGQMEQLWRWWANEQHYVEDDE